MRTMPNSRKRTGTLTKTRTEALIAETTSGTETGQGNGNKNGKRRRSIAPCDHEAESCGMCHVLLPCTARRAACRNPSATDPLGAHSAPGVINAMRPLCNNSNKNEPGATPIRVSTLTKAKQRQSKAKQSKAKQSRAKQSKAKQRSKVK